LDQYGIPHDNSSIVKHEDEMPLQVALLGRMGNDPGFSGSIPNAWMASHSAHPFFLRPTEKVYRFHLADKTRRFWESIWDWSWWYPSAEALTGPNALRKCVAEYEASGEHHVSDLDDSIAALVRLGPWALWEMRPELIVLPSQLIYPFSWGPDGKPLQKVCWVLEDTFNSTKCKEALGVAEKGSISITYWSHTHTKTATNTNNLQHVTNAEAREGRG
jgi:hypothetical protein